MTKPFEVTPPTVDPEFISAGQVYLLSFFAGYLFEKLAVKQMKDKATRQLTRLYAVAGFAMFLSGIDLIRTDSIHCYDFVPSALLALGMLAAHKQK